MVAVRLAVWLVRFYHPLAIGFDGFYPSGRDPAAYGALANASDIAGHFDGHPVRVVAVVILCFIHNRTKRRTLAVRFNNQKKGELT